MKTSFTFALLTLLSAGVSFAETPAAVDCAKISTSIKAEVAENQSLVLQIVDRAVRENPSCACEIVKASIVASNADHKLIASIVEVVATAAPDQMRIAAQCAVAVAPDALEDVQAVLAKLDPATGNGAADSAKGGVDKQPVAADKTPNPLDFPIDPSGVGFSPHSPGGTLSNPLFFGSQIIYISPPPATPNRIKSIGG
jgi:hypothetical protein